MMKKRCAVIGLVLLLALLGCMKSEMPELGVEGGKLKPCPHSSNCVSSQCTDKKHFVEPIPYSGPLNEARNRILSILLLKEQAKLRTFVKDYIRAECISKLFHFVDDIEFYFDDSSKLIHVRSASRTGFYDFGVNRRRVERIRREFDKR